MIFHFSIVHVYFEFCQLNFIALFPFLVKYCRVLFFIIVFRLATLRELPALIFRNYVHFKQIYV